MSELTKVELLANRQWEGVVAKVETERDKLRAELAAAQRELAACRKAFAKYAFRQSNENISLKEAEILVGRSVAELLAQEGVK